MIGTTPFVRLATTAAKALGLADLRLVVLEHPVGALGPERLAALQMGAMANIISRLVEAR